MLARPVTLFYLKQFSGFATPVQRLRAPVEAGEAVAAGARRHRGSLEDGAAAQRGRGQEVRGRGGRRRTRLQKTRSFICTQFTSY